MHLCFMCNFQIETSYRGKFGVHILPRNKISIFEVLIEEEDLPLFSSNRKTFLLLEFVLGKTSKTVLFRGVSDIKIKNNI